MATILKTATYLLGFCWLIPAQSQSVTITGEIINPKGNMVYLRHYTDFVSYDEVNIDADTLDANGMFSMEFNLTAPAYLTFAHGDEITAIYLTPGDNLNLTLDTKEFDESIRYTGTGENVNKNLAAK